MNLIKQLLMTLKTKALPSQETGASSQHSFPEPLHFPRLHYETQFVPKVRTEKEGERRRSKRERLRVGTSSSEKSDEGEKIAISIGIRR
jgi:hypothetical protein